MACRIGVRFPGDERQSAAGFQDALVHVHQVAEALLTRGGFKLCHGNQFPLQVLRVKFSALDQDVCFAFNKLIQILVAIQESNYQTRTGRMIFSRMGRPTTNMSCQILCMMRIPPSRNRMATFASVFRERLAGRAIGRLSRGLMTALPWELQDAGDLYFRAVQVLATDARLVIYRRNRLLDD
jgi:hypothetical protein